MGAYAFGALQGRVLYPRLARPQAAPRSRQGTPAIEPRRIPRSEHTISRSQLSSGSLKTLYTLRDAGFEAYVVGGGVRDLLAGLHPKDFDIATNAHPNEIKRLFRSCTLIGRRFVIAHVRYGQEILDVTTFRGPITDSHERDETGRILSDNQYGTLEEDAFRRDFTINALYYDIRDYSIVDFCGGLDDMKSGVVRLIGDPETRLREDPVRMLRAVRIANKLGHTIDAATAAQIPKLAPLLGEIPAARLFDEVIKVLQSKEAAQNFEGLRRLGLFAELFPQSDALLDNLHALEFVRAALHSTADRIGSGKPVSPDFLYAALLWPAVDERVRDLIVRQGHHPNVAFVQASEEVLAKAIQHIAIPKRFSVPMREIWVMQPRFEMRRSGRTKRLFTHPRFRAAYDFLLLRAQVGYASEELAQWWTTALEPSAELPPVPDDVPAEPKKKRRRRGSRRRTGGAPGGATPAPAGD